MGKTNGCEDLGTFVVDCPIGLRGMFIKDSVSWVESEVGSHIIFYLSAEIIIGLIMRVLFWVCMATEMGKYFELMITFGI